MSKFKVGDKVKLVKIINEEGKEVAAGNFAPYLGKKGEVVNAEYGGLYPIKVKFKKNNYSETFREKELIIAEPFSLTYRQALAKIEENDKIKI